VCTYTITIVYTFTKLHDRVGLYENGGNDEIRCLEIKDQVKQSAMQCELFPT